MPITRNGFRVEPTVKNLVRIDIAGIPFVVKRGYRNRCSKIWAIFLFELDKIEAVTKPGWDGGWSYRPVRGSTTVWSEHAAGMAIDWNASIHPMGGARYAGWTQDQVDQIRGLLSDPVFACIKWGADFTGRKDPMHFEMRSPASVRASYKALTKVRGPQLKIYRERWAIHGL